MKTFLITALVLSPSLLWAQGGAFTLTGKLIGSKAPAKAYLQYEVGAGPKMDSVLIQNGSFAFKGTVNEATAATLLIDKLGTGFSNRRPIASLSLYLEPGIITISSPDSLDNAVLSGTPLNTDSEKLKTALKPTSAKLTVLSKEYQKATPEQRLVLDRRFKEIYAERKAVRGAFIQANPQSLVSLDALTDYGGWAPEYTDVSPLFNELSEAVKTSKAGKAYATSLVALKATAIGAMAPEFTQADTAGRAVALRDFRGKYVLLDFWASWCKPCRAENPNVVKNYTQYQDKNFTVLGVSLDDPNGRDAWLRAIHKDGLTWTQVADLKEWDNEAAKLYGVRAIPQNYLIGPDGRIVAKNLEGDELGKKLAEVLVNKP